MTTASAHIKLADRPGSRLQIAQAFFGPVFREEQDDALQIYFIYYHEELELLRKGISEESWQTKGLAAKTYEDIFYVSQCVTRQWRFPTSRAPPASVTQISLIRQPGPQSFNRPRHSLVAHGQHTRARIRGSTARSNLHSVGR